MRLFLFSLLFPLFLTLSAQEDEWLTYYENHDYNGTPRYTETMDFCRRLATETDMIHIDTIGISPQGRPVIMLVIDKDVNFTPEKVKQSGKAVLLVQSGIHPGEPDGKEAMLLILRDMVVGNKDLRLLDHVTVLWIPILNVDGHERYSPYSRINQNGPEEMGWRTNAQNLNLNRDYLKADAPETQAWLRAFNRWLPDFFIDCHTTDGADYQYPITQSMETFGNMDAALTLWQRDVYLPAVELKMDQAGFPMFQYVSFRRWHDPRSGLYVRVALPRLSEGYTAIQNRPGLLIETHMLKPYRVRVESTQKLILSTLELLDKEYVTLKELNQKADDFCASESFRKTPLALDFATSFSDSVMVDFLGIEYDRVTSDLSGGDWFRYGEKPETFVLPMFNTILPSYSVRLPEAYIIPPEWTTVIEKLKLHGVSFQTLAQAVDVNVNRYRLKNYAWQKTPNEGRQVMLKLEVDEFTETVSYPAGSVLVLMNQRTARVIAHMLEPKGPDSFVYWGFFNAITEQKEYAESYSMEKIARQMLQENPDLNQQFTTWKEKNPELSKSSYAVLNWFYQQSPWWDVQKDLYPVGRIMNKIDLPVIE